MFIFQSFSKVHRNSKIFIGIQRMAKSSFEYVKNFELDDTLLANTWIVVRLDGKCFHKFSEDHNFVKPNDIRALNLMNYAAFSVFREFNDLLMAFGQSDEYSFIFKKNTKLYKRRGAKLLTTINSKFSTSYVYYWHKFFPKEKLKYPPTFDGRIVLYPSEENVIDYMKWRQADVHINNLYNTTFWALVQKGNLSPMQVINFISLRFLWDLYIFASKHLASGLNLGPIMIHSLHDDSRNKLANSVTGIPVFAEKRLCGTVSADKNEILFNEFNINYNNEPEIFKRGTLLLRKSIQVESLGISKIVIVDVHDDMLKDAFWNKHSNLLGVKTKPSLVYDGPVTDIINEQIKIKDL